MNTTRLLIAAGTCLVAQVVYGQQIQVQKKPAPAVGQGQYVDYDDWTVSFSRKSNATVFELDSFHGSEQAAMARARQLINWSKTITDPDWQLAVIQVEGDPEVKDRPEVAARADADRKVAAAEQAARRAAEEARRFRATSDKASVIGELFAAVNEVASTLHAAYEAVETAKKFAEIGFYATERKLGATLEEFKGAIEMIYEIVRDTRSNLVSLIGSITKKQFDNVNQLIAAYNQAAASYNSARPGARLPALATVEPVSPNDLRGTLAQDPPADSLAGTYWQRQGQLGIGLFSGLSFAADHTVRISVYPDGRRTATWRQEGTRVIITEQGDTYYGTYSGGLLQMDFGRGMATFARR